MKPTAMLIGAAAAASLAALAGSALAADASKPGQSCFFARDWQGWKAPNDKTLYIRVNNRDVYQVDLQGGSDLLNSPTPHLINRTRGPDTICTPLDLDLEVSAGTGGPVVPLIAKSLVKLTPQQVAAIPKKDLP